MTVTLYLTPQDTLPSVLARLRAAQDEQVLFVVPQDLCLNTVDLDVMRREAVARGRTFALVTDDWQLRALAAAAGISTFRQVSTAEESRWRRLRVERRGIGRPSGPAQVVPPHAPGLYGEVPPSGFRPVQFLRSFVRRSNPWWTNLRLALLLMVLFLGLLVILSYVIPAAEITVVPSSEPINITVALRAVQDGMADAETGVLPAKAISVQVAGEARMPTSGKSREPSVKATGQVSMVNRTSRPVTVPAGTLVATATGDNVRFNVTTQTDIPPNGKATVPIEAVLPGEAGNVRAGTITQVDGPLGLSLLVTNEVPTTGGGSAEVGIVTEEDQQRLQAQLFEDLKQKALDQLRDRLPANSFLPPDAITFRVLSPTFTPFLGDVAPELFLSMSVQAVGLAVDTSAGQEIALARLQGAMPPGTRLIASSLRFIPGSIQVEDAQTVAFSMTAEGTLLRAVDGGVVRSTVLGMRPQEAEKALLARLPLATSPRIHLGPDWLPLIVPTDLPVIPWRIRVHVDWDTAAQLAMQR